MAVPFLVQVLQRLQRSFPPSSALDDGELLQRFAAQRDEEAFRLLVQRHGPLVLRVCRQVLHHVHDADDAFQATFLVLARKAGTVRHGEALAGWLYRIAYRVSVRAVARAAARRAQEQQVAAMRDDPSLYSADRPELGWLVHEEVNRLPERYRLPVVLCYLHGKTNEEAARALCWPLGTVKIRLTRARDLLRQRLTRRGLALASGTLPLLESGEAPAAVPAGLVADTVRAAGWFVGEAAHTGPAEAAALAKEVLHIMAWTKTKYVVTLLLVLSLAAAGGSALVRHLRSHEPPEPAPVWAPAALAEEGRESKPSASVRLDAHGDAVPPGAVMRLGTVRFRHSGPISAISFAPDGKTVATASWQRNRGDIYLWETATGREIARLEDKQDRVYAGQALFVAFAPDGRTLAVCGGKVLRLLDVATQKERWRAPETPAAIGCIVFSPDGVLVAGRCADKTVRLWETASGRVLRQTTEHAGSVQVLAFAPDGKRLASSSGGTVYLWDAATAKEVQQLPLAKGQVTALAFAPDGKAVAVGYADATVRVWDLATGQEARQLRKTGAPSQISAVAYAPDGATLAGVGWDKAVHVWDTATGQLRHELGRTRHGSSTMGPPPLAFSPDGRWLAGRASFDSLLRLWDTTTGREVHAFPGHDHPLRQVAFTPDGRTVISGGRDGFGEQPPLLWVWDVATGKPGRTLQGHVHGIEGIACSADGHLLATSGNDVTLRLWDVGTGRQRLQFRTTQGESLYTTLAFSPDGKQLATGGKGTLAFWDVGTGVRQRVVPVARAGDRPLRPLDDGVPWVRMLAFASDGKRLTGHSSDGVLRSWDVTTGKEVRLVTIDGTDRERLAVSPDSRLLATAGKGDGTVHLWEASTGKARCRVASGHPRDVQALAYSPSGRTLATCGWNDSVVRLWDIATGKEVRRLEGHRGAVTSVAFAAGGRRLVTGSDDTTLLVWEIADLPSESRPRAAHLPEADIDTYWAMLASDDGFKVHEAVYTLAARPQQAVRLFRERLQPAVAPEPQRLARLVADLDSATFTVREKATTELERLGALAATALEAALAGQPALETRRRLEQLLSKVGGPVTVAETARMVRAVEVLERLATAEARQRLAALAAGAAPARLTQEAQAALQRLEHPGAQP